MVIKIDKYNVDVRLDRFLKNNCKENKLSEIFSAIRKGNVKVNKKKSKQNYRLQLNDEISINNLIFNEKEKKEIKIKNKDLIFYEDEDIIIIDKPKGIAMHKGTNTKLGLAESTNLTFANRLDKKTSGLVLACKNPKSLREITALIRENKVIKKYKAKTKDNGKFKVGDKFIITNSIENKECKTSFSVIKIDKGIIEFDIRLFTGRKHQIRIHLSQIGLPIIGDDKYGNYSKEDELELECYYLKFNSKEFVKK